LGIHPSDNRNAPNLGELIKVAPEAIEDADKEKLDEVFRNIDFNSEAVLGRTAQRNERLKHLLQDFHDLRLDLRPSRVCDLDIIGDAYEYLIERICGPAGGSGSLAIKRCTRLMANLPSSSELPGRLRRQGNRLAAAAIVVVAGAEEGANAAAVDGAGADVGS